MELSDDMGCKDCRVDAGGHAVKENPSAGIKAIAIVRSGKRVKILHVEIDGRVEKLERQLLCVIVIEIFSLLFGWQRLCGVVYCFVVF